MKELRKYSVDPQLGHRFPIQACLAKLLDKIAK